MKERESKEGGGRECERGEGRRGRMELIVVREEEGKKERLEIGAEEGVTKGKE